MDSNELRILEGASTTAGGGLMIGVGNSREEEGRTTCGLSLSSPYRTGRRIEVVRIERDGAKGVVVLKISSP